MFSPLKLASLGAVLLALTATTSATTAPPAFNPAVLPFNFTYLFTAHLALGSALPRIPVQGGVLVAEPIVNGTVTGPYINATISSGIATPSIYNNGTLQVPVIRAWGVTNDGAAFVLNEMGTGSTKAQVTRIQIDIGGGDKYAALRDGFVLASVNPNANQTEVAVHGYLVEDITTYS